MPDTGCGPSVTGRAHAAPAAADPAPPRTPDGALAPAPVPKPKEMSP